MMNCASIVHAFLAIHVAARAQFGGFLPENRAPDNIPHNRLRINTYASVDFAQLKVS
jgi:hypothetical protein